MVDTSVRSPLQDLSSARHPKRNAVGAFDYSKFGSCATILSIVEFACIILAALAAKFLYIDLIIGQPQPTWPYLAPALVLASMLYLLLNQAELYDPNAITQPVVAYGKVFGAIITSFLLLLGILYVLKLADWYSRAWFLTWFFASAATVIAARLAGTAYVRHMVEKGVIRRRIALYGDPDFVAVMKTRIETSMSATAIKGIYLSNSNASDQHPSHGGLNELKDAIESKSFDTVLVGFSANDTACIQSAINQLAAYSTELLLCTHLDSEPTVIRGAQIIGTLRTDIINLVPLSESNRVLKSGLDYLIAGIALFLLSPLLGLIAVAVKLDSPGPVFFRQRRYGQNNRIFRIIKFRTMFVAEDGQNVQQAQRNDVRVTRVGWFLRRTSLDELPQLLNVLAGDMSIVGPRPHALAHDQLFEKQLDYFSLRRRVRPGLTGWAQVHGLRGETRTALDIRRRVEHDLYYIDNWSIWLDVEVIIRTMFVFFRGAF